MSNSDSPDGRRLWQSNFPMYAQVVTQRATGYYPPRAPLHAHGDAAALSHAPRAGRNRRLASRCLRCLPALDRHSEEGVRLRTQIRPAEEDLSTRNPIRTAGCLAPSTHPF